MNIQITFQNCDSSAEMEKHINEQLVKIVRFLEKEPTPVNMDIIIQPGRTHAHYHVEFLLKTPNYDLVTHDEGPKVYQLVDSVIDTMYAQLRKQKDRHVEDRKMVGRHEDFKKQR